MYAAGDACTPGWEKAQHWFQVCLAHLNLVSSSLLLLFLTLYILYFILYSCNSLEDSISQLCIAIHLEVHLFRSELKKGEKKKYPKTQKTSVEDVLVLDIITSNSKKNLSLSRQFL